MGPQRASPTQARHWGKHSCPQSVWDATPSSELSSGFSLGLTHGSLPVHRVLAVVGHSPARDCTRAQRHAQGCCSLDHPLHPSGWLALG